MPYNIAGIDIHKKVLMVVVADVSVSLEEFEFESRRFATTASERQRLAAWLRERGVQEIVMESTAQYWRPIWLDLEPLGCKMNLAQAHSNRAPQGRKYDFADAQRLIRRLVAGELILSLVPDAEQRGWRTMTRGKLQLVCDRVRLQNQLEALLEETRIKLSSVISELLGLSGRRILRALADGKSDPAELAKLGDCRLKCSPEQLADALNGHLQPLHLQILKLFLERLDLLDRQIEQLDRMIAEALQQHQQAVTRLAEVPGFGPDSAQQVIAEVGTDARYFPTPAQFASWVGVCPGSRQSAEQNHSSRSPKGNRFLRRILTQAAQAAVKKKGSHFQMAFRRLVPKLGYKGAIWAMAHTLSRLVWKVLHDGIHYIERGQESDPQTKKRRAQNMLRALRRMGYQVVVSPTTPEPAQG